MLEKELKNIWVNASQSEKIRFDLSKLLIELNNKMKNIERNIRNRDRREIVASLIGMPIFAYFAYEIPFPITKAACILAIVIFGYIIYRLRSNRKEQYPVDMSLPFKAQLEQQKLFMNTQKNLLATALYWYVLPPFIMNIIFILGIGDPAAYNWTPKLLHLLPVTDHEKITMIIFLAVFYSLIAWINIRASKKVYEPLIADIEKVQQQLVNEE